MIDDIIREIKKLIFIGKPYNKELNRLTEVIMDNEGIGFLEALEKARRMIK